MYSLIFFQNAEPRGVLKVTFVNYVNPDKGDYDGSCCDPFVIRCDDCDTYFEICLQSTYIPVAKMDKCIKFVRTKMREDDNFKFDAKFGSKGEKNPLEYHFDDSWKVCDLYLL